MNLEKMMKEWDDSIPDEIKRMSADNRAQTLKIRELETELAALKAEVTQYEWKEGHPEHEAIVNVCVKVRDGYKFYSTDHWRIVDRCWNFYNEYNEFGQVAVAWSEIRPYGGE